MSIPLSSSSLVVPATPGEAVSTHGASGGNGHSWWKGPAAQVGSDSTRKRSLYVCRQCGIEFVHFYDARPFLSEAMDFFGVPEECTSAAVPPSSNDPTTTTTTPAQCSDKGVVVEESTPVSSSLSGATTPVTSPRRRTVVAPETPLPSPSLYNHRDEYKSASAFQVGEEVRFRLAGSESGSRAACYVREGGDDMRRRLALSPGGVVVSYDPVVPVLYRVCFAGVGSVWCRASELVHADDTCHCERDCCHGGQ